MDLKTLGENDYFIEGIMLPKTQGKADCGAFTITLTDIEDENEVITITCKDSTIVNDGGRGMYVLSKTTNQRVGGLEGDSKYHNDGNWGSLFHSSFLGLPLDGVNFPFRFYFDVNELAMYGYPSNSHGKSLNNDFNSADFYGYNTWGGFPSGKVKIAISMSNLVGSSAKMLISSIGGISLTNDLLEDNVAPVISIDKGNLSSLPSGEINKKYCIFPANVSDNLYDGVTYKTYVTYKDVVSDVDVDVESNSEYFIPKKAGTYTIHYVAIDNFGNSAEEQIDVQINEEVQHIFLDVDTTPIEAELFSSVNITPLTNVKGYGGNSDLTLAYNVYDSEYNKVEVNDDRLVLEKLGKYYIVYSATDYIGNVGYATIEVNSKAPIEPKAKSDIRLNKAYMKGLSYIVDDVEGFEVNNGVIAEISPKILINNVETKTFVATGSSTNIKYVYEGKTGTKEYNFDIPVKDGNHGGAIDQYFVGENYEAETHQDYTLFKSSSDFEASFVNPINAAVFSFGFTFNNNKSNFSYFTLKLTNYLNNEESITFYFKRINNNSCKVKIGLDGTETTLNSGSGLFKITYNSFEKKLYNDAGIDIGLASTSDNGKPLTKFAGAFVDIGLVDVFDESEIKVNELCGQQMGHGQLYRCDECKKWYNESSLNNGYCPIHSSNHLEPNLDQENFDYIDPTVYLDGSLPGVIDAGTTLVMPKVYAFDVLNYVSIKEITISYKSSAEESTYTEVKKCDVDELENFTFTNPGVYSISYRICDSVDNDYTFRKIINCYENTAPSLTVDRMKAAYYVNSEIQIPNYQASDNSGKWTVEVYLYLPNDEMRLLLVDKGGKVTSLLEMSDQTYPSNFKVSGNNKAFRVLTKGNYRLKVVAYDAYYNKVSDIQTFNVR